MSTDSILQAISKQKPGWSLQQAFYVSPEVFELERRGWLAEQWYVLAHISELPQSGSYVVRNLLGESVLIVRGSDDQVRGFFNVCRHRGSRICDADGTSAALVCPYHGWTFRLDGSLRSAPALSPDIDKQTLGLRTIAVRNIGGLILGSLVAEVHALDGVAKLFEPGLVFHGIPNARIAARRHYPTRANWKLVVENFIECYHCLPSHPEYSSVMRHVDVFARQTAEAGAGWQKIVSDWEATRADPHSPVPFAGATSAPAKFATARFPIDATRQTQSQDGRPVAPLMGSLSGFDGGVSTFRHEPFVFCGVLNDYAVLFQIFPVEPEVTHVTITWLVSGSATEAEVDVERMVWLWDVTTRQDKTIVERNAAGVRSQAYEPGPYSELEPLPARFVSGYLQDLARRIG